MAIYRPLFILAFLPGVTLAQQGTPLRFPENRAVWLSNVGSRTIRDPSQLKQSIRLLAQMGFNTLYPVTFNKGCTLYPSPFMAAHTGQAFCENEGLENRNYLNEVVVEAKNYGMRVLPWHEWGVKVPRHSQLENHLTAQNLLTSNIHGCRHFTGFGSQYAYMNLFKKEAQDFVIGLLKEQVTLHEVQGFQLDDHMLFPNDVGYDGPTLARFFQAVANRKFQFRGEAGKTAPHIRIRYAAPQPPPTQPDLLKKWQTPTYYWQRTAWEGYQKWLKNPNDPSAGTPLQRRAWTWAKEWDSRDEAIWQAWLQWRRQELTQFFRRLSVEVKAAARARGRQILFSLSPHSPRWSFDHYSQDWGSWLTAKDPFVDEVVVQNYARDPVAFAKSLEVIKRTIAPGVVPHRGKLSVAIFTGKAGEQPLPTPLIEEQIQAARRGGIDGFSFFYFDSMANLTVTPSQRLLVTSTSQQTPLPLPMQNLREFANVQYQRLRALQSVIRNGTGASSQASNTPTQSGSGSSIVNIPFHPVTGCSNPPVEWPAQQNLWNPGLLDIEGHWAESRVRILHQAGIVMGLPGGEFEPLGTLTRGAFAAMLAQAFEMPDGPPALSFKDMENHWAKGAVGSVAARGFMRGFPDGTFRPDTLLTKAQGVASLVAGLKGKWKSPPAAHLNKSFDDVPKIPDWAIEHYKMALSNGILFRNPYTVSAAGRSLAEPMAPLTRAEAAAMVYEALVMLGDSRLYGNAGETDWKLPLP